MTHSHLPEAAATLRQALAASSRGLVEREALVETIALAAVASEHVLVIGPPGTAKSEAVRRFTRAVHATCFEYLLNRFTEPSEIFGPVDLRRLREGVVETDVQGMLPAAEVAFLDEVFQGSTAILNTLLGILNERTFRRGHTHLACPLRVCVGAANSLPTDDTLAAFSDRFLLRVFVQPIADPRLEELLEGGWSTFAQPEPTGASVANLDVLTQAVRATDVAGVRPALAHAVRLLRAAGVHLSDRRIVKVQRLVAAAAVLDGRSLATEADLWPLVLAAPSPHEQAIARDCLRESLAATRSTTLQAAAEEASLGPLVRAQRLAEAGRSLLARRPQDEDAAALADWQLRLEAVAREIDVTFSSEQLPEGLASVRATIVEQVQRATSEPAPGAASDRPA